MAEPPRAIIERFALNLANGGATPSREEEVEFARALIELGQQVEHAVGILSRLLELGNPKAPPRDLHLTHRELEMLSHLAEGHCNSEIARLCWISENTVKFHLKNLFRKLQVRDRVQAMMIARAMRWQLDLSASNGSQG
jgi:DNA-binding NarL/FixJ family response regulator